MGSPWFPPRWSAVLFLCATAGASFLEAREIELHGRLLGRGGMPVQGAEVRLHRWRSTIEMAYLQPAGVFHPEALAVASSDADGHFRVLAPRPGRWELAVRHPGYAPVVRRLVPLFGPLELGDVELPPGREHTIRIVDEKGRGLAGFKLLVRGSAPSWQGSTWALETRRLETSDEGSAVFLSAEGESLSVVGLGAGRVLFRRLRTESGPLRLTPAGRFRPGRVTDLDDRPLPGVVGILTRGLMFGPSDEDGNLALPHGHRPGERWSQPLDQPDALTFADPEVDHLGTVRPIETERGLLARVPESLAVRGRVVDKATGQGITGALVQTAAGGRTTGEGGLFSARVPAARGEDRVSVMAAGYLAASASSRQLEPKGQGLAKIALEPALTLPGRVIDAVSGETLPGAQVRIRVDRQALFSAHRRMEHFLDKQRTTDEEGAFRFGGLSPSIPYRIRASRDGFAAREMLLAPLGRDPPTEPVELALELGRRAFGRVLDSGDRPIVGAEVMLLARDFLHMSSGDPEDHIFRATSDDRGRFEVADVPPGVFLWQVDAAGYSRFESSGAEITDGPGPAELGTVCLEEGVTLEGQVVDGGGRPLEGARVDTRPGRTTREPESFATTDAQGLFRISDLSRDGAVELSVWAEGYQSVELSDVAVERIEPLKIVLEPAAVLRGRAVDDAGRGVQARVTMRNPEDGSTQERDTSLGGGFEFSNAVPGLATLSARSPRWRGERRGLRLEAGQIHEVELVLEPAARLRGTVVDPDGDAVGGARLSLKRRLPDGVDVRAFQESEDTYFDLSAPDGSFDFLGLASGSYRLSVRHEDFEPLDEAPELAGSSVRELELRFLKRRPKLIVEGRVVDEHGAGVEGARVRLLREHGWTAEAKTTRGGHFELRAPRPGVYRVGADAPDLAAGRGEPFEVSSAGVRDLVVELGPGATLSGRILGLEDGSYTSLVLIANSRDIPARFGTVERDGRYRVRHLSAGDWRVQAIVPVTDRTASGEIEVAGADRVHLDLEFRTASHLQGRVRLDGNPLAAGEVEPVCGQNNLFPRKLRSDGRFEISGVPDGPCRLWIGVHNRAIFGVLDVELPRDSDVLVELWSGRLSGVVSTAESLPLVGVRVEVSPAVGSATEETRSDASGRFTFPVITHGEWRLRSSLDGFAEALRTVRLQGPSKHVEILLRPTSPAVLRVRTEEGAVPSVVGVTIFGEDGRPLSSQEYRPDSDGRIVLRRLGPGRHRLDLFDNEGRYGQVDIDVPGEPLMAVLQHR